MCPLATRLVQPSSLLHTLSQTSFVSASLYPSLKLHTLLWLSHAVHSEVVQDQFDTSHIVLYVLHTSLQMLVSHLHIKAVSMLEYGYRHGSTFFGGCDYNSTFPGLHYCAKPGSYSVVFHINLHWIMQCVKNESSKAAEILSGVLSICCWDTCVTSVAEYLW